MPFRWIASALLLASALPVAAQAPLTLAEALRLAEKRAPVVSAFDAAARGARESAIASGQLPDPVLRAGIDNLPVNGPDAWSLDRDFMTMRRIGVMQEYVSSAKRTARQARGERDAQRWAAEAQVSLAEIRVDVAGAWYDRYYGLETERLQQGLAQEIAMQRRAVEAQVASGKATVPDVLAIDAMLAQARDRVLAARRQQQVAVAKLSRWLGADADRPPGGDASMPRESEDAALRDHALHDIPQMRLLASQVEVADAEVQIAQEERSSNWSVELSYQVRGPAYSNMISVGVNVPLPLFRAERQDRELAARLAQRDQARELMEDARRRYASEFDSMRLEWLALRDRQRDLEAGLLPAVRQRVDAVLAGYASGQQSLATVLEARRAEVDARAQILDLEREAARLWARLRFTYLTPDGAKS